MRLMAREHDPCDAGRLINLWPMPCIKDMKRSVAGLRSYVFGDGDVKVGVGLSPDKQEGNVGAPELDQASCAGGDLFNW